MFCIGCLSVLGYIQLKLPLSDADKYLFPAIKYECRQIFILKNKIMIIYRRDEVTPMKNDSNMSFMVVISYL